MHSQPFFSKETYSFLFIFQLAELFAFSWTFGEFLCKFVNYMQNVSAVSSVLNLTVMSIERYEIMLLKLCIFQITTQKMFLFFQKD